MGMGVKNKINNCRKKVTVKSNKAFEEIENIINETISKVNQEITIKLKRCEIPLLLGSARLGIWGQRVCDDYLTNSHSMRTRHRWILEVDNIITEIKNQTSISEEETLVSEDLMQEIETIYKAHC